AELPLRVHHHAFAVKDQEVNRHFIEDILGIPLTATWCERTFNAVLSRHVAFKVSQSTFAELESRLRAADIPYRRTDHGYCVSMYVKTPDGLPLEFTVDAPDIEAIAAMRRADAHSELTRWLAGDHRPNNDQRPH